MKKKSYRRKYLIASVAFAAFMTGAPLASGQTAARQDIMAANADGYYQRAVDMMRHDNYSGVIDQLRHALSLDNPLWTVTVGDGEMRRVALSMMLRAAYERGDEALFNHYYEPFVTEYNGYPEAVEAKLMYADMFFFKGNYPAAVNAYKEIDFGALSPEKEALYNYRLGLSYIRTGYFSEANKIFRKLRKNSEYEGVSIFYLAYINYVQGNLKEARQGFIDVPADVASELGATYYLTQIDFEDGAFTNVIARGRLLLPDAPKEWKPELNRIIGESYYNLGNLNDAKPYLLNYVASDREPQLSSLYDLGVISYEEGAYNDAHNYFSRLVNEANAMSQSAYLYIGQLAAREGDYSGAAMAFKSAYDLNIDKNVSEIALYDYAVATMKGGQVPFGSSSKMLENFVKIYPNSPYSAKIDEYLATACYNDKDYAGALKHIERLRQPSKANQESKQKILFQLGVQALNRKQYGEAAGYMKRAAGMASEADAALAAQASLWEGEALYALSDYAGATKAYTRFANESNARTENRALGLYNLGYSLYQEKKFKDARRYFSEALSTSPGLPSRLVSDCKLRVADCDYYAGNVTAAMSAYASLASDTKNAEADYAAFQHANMMGASGDNESKVKELDAMLKKFPDSSWVLDARLELVNALCAVGNIDRANDEAQFMLQNYASSPQTRKAALAVASAWQDKDDYPKAINAFKALVTRWPSSSEAEVGVNALKTIYTDEGDMQGFLSFLDSVPTAPRPDAAEMEELTYQAAYNRAQRNNNDIEALNDYIIKYPNGANADRALLTLAHIYHQKGDDALALGCLNQLLDSRPDSESVAPALMLQAQLLEKEGDNAAASKAWEQLLDKGGSLYAVEAYTGLMRTADSLDSAMDYANHLLELPGVDSETIAKATLVKGMALAENGDYAAAEPLLAELAQSPQTEQGAHAAVVLGEMLLKQGNVAKAQKVLEEFIDSDTSQNYWLARGYIALADVFRAQNDIYNAKEYLRALKSNYPGKEADIQQMIESRLSELK